MGLPGRSSPGNGRDAMKLFDEMPTLESGRLLLRELVPADAPALGAMARDTAVYRYLPTFLFEQKYPDPAEVIRRMRAECFEPKESLILGIFEKADGSFCGLAEFYGFKDRSHSACVGNRLAQDHWGRGIASETLSLMIDHVFSRTDTEILTASTMVENRASARVLQKHGFTMSAHAVPEDWGYPEPTIADKWFL